LFLIKFLKLSRFMLATGGTYQGLKQGGKNAYQELAGTAPFDHTSYDGMDRIMFQKNGRNRPIITADGRRRNPSGY
jgi:hypothetical protein